jgi:nitroreductase
VQHSQRDAPDRARRADGDASGSGSDATPASAPDNLRDTAPDRAPAIAPDAAPGDDALATLDRLFAARWSCRAFLPEPIPEATVTRIVATAQRVASWNNTQPWQLIVTRKPETDRLRAALYAHAQTAAPAPDIPFPTAYEGVYKARRSACGWQLYDAVGVARGDRAASGRQTLENFRFFGAPHVALVTAPAALGTYGVLDCGAFVTGFMTAAQAAGVATIAQAALATQAPFLRDWFAVPEDRWIVCGIAFGRADPDHPANGYRTARASPDGVVDWRG